MDTHDSIWKALTPNAVLSAIEEVVGRPLSNLCLPRNSYINRVFEIEYADKSDRLIAKFYRPSRWSKEMIVEEHDFISHLFKNEIPVIPPLSFAGETLFEFEGILFAIFPKKGGRAIDELSEDLWKEVGRLLARIHNLSETLSSSSRVLWRPKVASTRHLKTLKDSGLIPDNYQDSVTRVVTQLIETKDVLFDGIKPILLHGDCHFGNVIYRPDESLYLVDFDDAVIGPEIQDAWMLFPGDISDCDRELNWFKDGYTVFRDFPHAQLKIVPILRAMRQLHFSAWCAIQSKDPQFQHHFPEWGSISYWNTLVKDLQEIAYS